MIAVSVVRDTFGGRQMAEVMSLVFMVFMIIPVIAPGIGQFIILFAEWHAIFLAIATLGLVFAIWTALRLPETLRPENQRAFTAASIAEGFRIVVTNRMSFWYTVASTALFGALFGFINSAQQIYIGIYDTGTMFPALFAMVAGMMAVTSFVNSRFVGRFGMRRLSQAALTGSVRHRLPNLASFTFAGTSGEAVLLELERRGVVSSSGSACRRATWRPSCSPRRWSWAGSCSGRAARRRRAVPISRARPRSTADRTCPGSGRAPSRVAAC